MIATEEQTDALRARFGIDPDHWRKKGDAGSHLLVCQDFAFISYARICLMDNSSKFRIFMKDAQSSWNGVNDGRPPIPHAYLVDLQNRMVYNRGVSWPVNYAKQYANFGFNQIKNQGDDSTAQILAHASTRVMPTLEKDFPPDPPGFNFYSWLRDPQLAGEFLGISGRNTRETQQSLMLIFSGLAARLLLRSGGRI